MFDLDNLDFEENQPKDGPDKYDLARMKSEAYEKEYDEMLEKHRRNEPVNIERAEFLQQYLIRNGHYLYDRISWDW